ncbi:MAG: 23S rRNA (pseudouridine(1915)-N(3))-methyltransferase RlmH [Sphingobacteriaceae bacterium]|jgi:23S rRNA (pseudouridine1915-N3)-methyltransferase
MTITFIQIDKTQDSYLIEGMAIYLKRLKNYCSLDVITINVPKNVRLKTEKEQKTEEAKLILNELKAGDNLVLLDEKGKQMSSQEFAQFMNQKQNSGIKRLVFLIGGPFGFDQKIYERANFKLGLSQMTFSHQMVRLFFLEQLYRAYTILGGEKYHHE